MTPLAFVPSGLMAASKWNEELMLDDLKAGGDVSRMYDARRKSGGAAGN